MARDCPYKSESKSVVVLDAVVGVSGFVHEQLFEFGEGLILDLAYTFTGTADLLTDFFEGQGTSAAETEAHFEDLAFSFIEFIEQIHEAEN